MADRPDRLTGASELQLHPESLVGSFFHSDAERGWQGCIVAEPSPGVYLVELFEWLAGSSSNQCLVSIDDMAGWQFYDNAEWMAATYKNELKDRWEQERADKESSG